ncbi:heat stress transcription factor A-1a-like [Apium graveolens]|uniref:heat stress transcription factor A-1a-like n=1 Tax=Apium graveolens TaxID=4045 RepID=UPI003D7BD2F2
MEIVSTEQNKSLDVCVASGSRHNRRLSSSTGRRLRVPPFLNKVYEFVDDPDTDAIISWSSGGTRFTVWDHHVFSRQILPRYFRHDVFSSFVYQLNNYGFKKTSWDFWEYENQWFQQGKENLLLNIKRKNDTNSLAIKRSRAAKGSLDAETLIIENLVKKQEIMEKQIHSLIKQQKIVISMLGAFVPKYAQQMVQNGAENNAMVATQSRANEDVLVFGRERENTAQQNLISFGDSGNLVKNQECNIDAGNCVPSSSSCLWSLMAVDDNHEQAELAFQHSSMEFEDLMTPTEQWGYLGEFMSEMEFQETKAEIETKPALLQGEEKKLV